MSNPLIQVSWLDAQDHPSTWVDTKDAEDFTDIECLVVSVGWLIKKTSKYLTLGSDYDAADDNYGTVRKIPISMVDKIEYLEKKNPT